MNEWGEQLDATSWDDPLLDSLVVLTRHFGIPRSAEALIAGLPLVEQRLTPALFVHAAERIGLSARVLKRPLCAFSDMALPVVLLLKQKHCCVVAELPEADCVRVIQPESGGGVTDVSLSALRERYTGYAIFVAPTQHIVETQRDFEQRQSGHWFRQSLRGMWPVYFEAALAALLINIFALASPLFVMNVYDRVAPNQAFETLWVLALGVMIVVVFDFLIKGLRNYFIDAVGKQSDVRLSNHLFTHILHLKLAVKPGSSGSLANSLHEFESFREFFTSASLAAFIDLPFVSLFIGIIWLIGGPVAWSPIIAIPVMLGMAFIVQRPLRKTVECLFEHAGRKSTDLFEAISGLEVVKASRAEGERIFRWSQLSGGMARLGMRARLLSSFAVNFSALVQQTAIVSVVVIGVYQMAAQDLSMGGLIACTMLTGRALAPLAQVTALITRYHQAMAGYRALNDVMSRPIERPAGQNFVHRASTQGRIELQQVKFHYPEQPLYALNDVSLEIRTGEKIGIIGPVGSGKSTLHRLLMGLYEPLEGRVLLDGVDLRQIDPADLRRHIGFVPQDAFLFSGSIKDNITLGARFMDDQALLQAAELAGVTEFTNAHPHGLDWQVGERGGALSGGQRQMVTLARALLLKPKIVLLDEPSSAMDNSTEARFNARFLPFLEGRTLLLVTQRMSMLQLVERLVVMEAGKIVLDGPKDQVLQALQGKPL